LIGKTFSRYLHGKDWDIATSLTLDESDRPAIEQDAEISGWTYPGLDYSTFRLSLVAKAIDRLTLKMLADNCDLTIAEWRVLSRLAPIRGASVREVSQMAWVDRAEVSRAAASLEARGLTSRRVNPSDGRSPILFATEEGLALYRRLLPIRGEFHRRLAADLTDAERDLLDGLLFKIARKVARLAGDQAD
jgi:DNA-binding MarR family transcriptional regulator